MNTRHSERQVFLALARLEADYYALFPEDYYQTIVGESQWDGFHLQQLRQLAAKRAWNDMLHYIHYGLDTALREAVQDAIQQASPRLYQKMFFPPTT